MKIRTMGKCVKDGFRGVFRNGLMSLASIGTITACLIILGIVYILVMNVQSFTVSLDGNLGLVAFLKAGISEEEVRDLERQLDTRSDVESYHYVSAEEAWETFKNDMLGGDELGELLGEELESDNPLENAANIEIYTQKASDQAALAAYLESLDSVRKVSYSANASQALTSLGSLVTYVGMALILFLILIALLLIANTIKLSVYIRRYEVSIMKYIGATDAFVRLPFIIEGILIGCLGAILPTALVYFGYDGLIRVIQNRFAAVTSLFTFLSVGEVMQGLIPIFLVLSIVVGAVGSIISLRKHLRV